MNLRIGPPATGAHFFPRERLRKRLLRALGRGHVAFLGPRRTGKTSILKDLERHPPAGVVALYVDLQGTSSVPKWLEKMLAGLKLALQLPPEKWGWLKKGGREVAGVLKRVEELGVMAAKVKLAPGKAGVEEWRTVAEQLLAVLRESAMPVYFLLDEFPWFLGHVAKHYTVTEVEAVLSWFREARNVLAEMEPRFLVTGSIGLNGLLRRLGLTPVANDFDTVEIEPLEGDEPLRYLETVAVGEGVVLSKAATKRMVARLGCGWPILLAQFVSEVQEHGPKGGPKVRDIDELYADRLVRGSRNKYCDEMFTRIKKPELFSTTERALALGILREVCRCDAETGFGHNEMEAAHARLVPDAALRAALVDELDFVLETLRHDGYLLAIKDSKNAARDGRHCFTSHMLRDYWRHRTA